MMKQYRIALLIAIVLAVLSSCNNGQTLDLTYEVAGENRCELDAVIERYRTEDKAKLKAARFIISNMAFHGTKTSEAVDSFTKRLLTADTLTNKIMEQWWLDYKTIDKPQYLYDARALKADYIIDNIDAAFETWNRSPWKAEVSEELFFHHILPYRFVDEQLSPKGWRDSLFQRYHSVVDTITDLKRAYHALYRSVSAEVRVRHIGNMPYMLNAIDISHIKRGRCLQQCLYIAYVMRALGIPAVIDGITRWANYGTSGHSWVALVTADGTYTVGAGDSVARRYNPINSSSFSLKQKIEDDYPVPLDFVKTVPKIWRSSYAIYQPDYSDKAAESSVSDLFSQVYSQDVSGEYGLDGKYEFSLSSDIDCAYLAVFATGEDWTPVAYAQRNFYGKCCFEGLADSVIYLPMAYSAGKLKAISSPFFLINGKIRQISVDKSHTNTVVLTRKYPFARSILRAWIETLGASVVASNRSDFKNADTLYTVKHTPVFRNVIYPDSGESHYRYIKYVSHPRRRGSITELCVYSGGERLLGTPFINGAEQVERCFDGDTFTDIENRQIGYSVGVDLGKKVSVDSIAVYLRNDGNYIDIGDEYELLYYDANQWHSLGRQHATAEHLVFDNVPSGALLWLRDLSKGKEERIFIYENKKQTWW